jgi:hypothetical protein
VIQCDIVGAFNTSCDTGDASFVVQEGGQLRLLVTNVGGAAPRYAYYGYRAVTP